MIFPELRISELEKDAELKREQFTKSKNNFQDALQEAWEPLQFIKKNKTLTAGVVMGFLALGKIFQKTGSALSPRLKTGSLWTMLNAGLVWKILEISLNLYKLTHSKQKQS